MRGKRIQDTAMQARYVSRYMRREVVDGRGGVSLSEWTTKGADGRTHGEQLGGMGLQLLFFLEAIVQWHLIPAKSLPN